MKKKKLIYIFLSALLLFNIFFVSASFVYVSNYTNISGGAVNYVLGYNKSVYFGTDNYVKQLNNSNMSKMIGLYYLGWTGSNAVYLNKSVYIGGSASVFKFNYLNVSELEVQNSGFGGAVNSINAKGEKAYFYDSGTSKFYSLWANNLTVHSFVNVGSASAGYSYPLVMDDNFIYAQTGFAFSSLGVGIFKFNQTNVSHYLDKDYESAWTKYLWGYSYKELSALALDNDSIYFVSGGSDNTALRNLFFAELNYSLDITDQSPADWNGNSAYSNPVIYGNYVYVGIGGILWRFNKNNLADFTGVFYTQATDLIISGDWLYYIANGNSVVRLDLTNLTDYNWDEYLVTSARSLYIDGDNVYVGTDNGVIYLTLNETIESTSSPLSASVPEDTGSYDIDIPTVLVNTTDINQGLLPEIYYGTIAFFSHNLMPLIVIIFLIISVLIIISIGALIKKLFSKI